MRTRSTATTVDLGNFVPALGADTTKSHYKKRLEKTGAARHWGRPGGSLATR
jgi:hypothetical protein